MVLEGKELAPALSGAAALLASVVGQDIEKSAEGIFRIVRGVAVDRIISTVDPEARHGHKTAARGFDGYKGHAAVDPDSEIITETVVTAGNVGDAAVAEDLIADLLADQASTPAVPKAEEEPNDDGAQESNNDDDHDEDAHESKDDDAGVEGDEATTVYGDNAYGTGPFQERLEEAGIESRCKTQNPTAAGGLFTKDRFEVNLDDDTVTCPGGVTVTIRRHDDTTGTASFREACAGCSLREQCTTSSTGRTISIGAHEAALARARERQRDPAWQDDYRSTRPKVERKLAHLMRRRHGGRRARVRGKVKVDADFSLLAAASNLARLAVLGVRSSVGGGWAVA